MGAGRHTGYHLKALKERNEEPLLSREEPLKKKFESRARVARARLQRTLLVVAPRARTPIIFMRPELLTAVMRGAIKQQCIAWRR